jgi:hypothetical protein
VKWDRCLTILLFLENRPELTIISTGKMGRCDKTTMLQKVPGINTQESVHFRWVLKLLYIARKPDKPEGFGVR